MHPPSIVHPPSHPPLVLIMMEGGMQLQRHTKHFIMHGLFFLITPLIFYNIIGMSLHVNIDFNNPNLNLESTLYSQRFLPAKVYTSCYQISFLII